MIPPPFPHKHYLRFVLNKAGRYGGLRADHRHFHVWCKLKVTNLDVAYLILATLYSATQGRPSCHPVCMLRSCLAMMLCGITSFDVWVQMMRDDPFYALISGFAPYDVPGVGTFPGLSARTGYGFQDRPLQRLRQPRRRR